MKSNIIAEEVCSILRAAEKNFVNVVLQSFESIPILEGFLGSS